MVETAIMERTVVVRRGRRLEYFTVAWNTLEGLVAVIAGAIAGSISLVGLWSRQLHRGDVRGRAALADVR